MPILSTFFGIVIRMYHGDHPPAHFHAQYGEHEAIVAVATGRVLAGRLPPRAMRLVREWRRKHEAELQRAWGEAQAFKAPKRIRGLE